MAINENNSDQINDSKIKSIVNNDVAVAEELPRPPSGRRAATRPAGPPRQRTKTSTANKTETSVEEVKAVKDETNTKTQPSAIDKTASETVVLADEPSAKTKGSRRLAKKKAASDDALDAAIDAALEKRKTVAKNGNRRKASKLLGEDVPTKADGQIDKEQALQNLAASIGNSANNDSAKDDSAVQAQSKTKTETSQPNTTNQLVEDSEEQSKAKSKQLEPVAKKSKQLEPLSKTKKNAEAKETKGKKANVKKSADAKESGGTSAKAVNENDQEQLNIQQDNDRESDDSSTTTSDEQPVDAGETSGSRRRRRRGGRRRRRSGSSVQEKEDEQLSVSDESKSEQPAEDQPSKEDTQPETVSASNTSTTRRRRRRHVDSDGEVAVHVREPRPRAASDEITGIEGSTRLEAKRQRRKEGRAQRHRAPILSESEFLARRESVNRKLIIRQNEQYTQLAVLEDEILVEHYVDRSNSTTLIGNIYLGRIQNVLPSMEAVFIDIGRGRNAVLYAGEVNWKEFDVAADSRKVEEVFKSGQTVLVQVSKDPVGAKGARLTGHISIPGRFVVFSPDGHLSGISRKLPENERQRLKNILDEAVSEESSVIVRTAAEGASEDELKRDIERLEAQWEAIQKKAGQSTAPAQLYAEPNLTIRTIRDLFTEDFSEMVISGAEGKENAWDTIREYVEHVAPNLSQRLTKWDRDEQGDLFEKYRVEEQIAKGLERKVYLPSGGSLVIDRTEAMTVIDVNTGKFTGSGGNLEETVTKNNLEAAEEIVRQLRLRDIGGIVVIDFIDMVLPANRDLLLRRLVECLSRDRTRHQVSEVTSLGLVQMTRKRIGTGLAEAFTTECESCGGRGYIRSDHPVESQAPSDGGARAKPAKRQTSVKAKQSSNRANSTRSKATAEATSKVAAAAKHGGETPNQTLIASDDE